MDSIYATDIIYTGKKNTIIEEEKMLTVVCVLFFNDKSIRVLSNNEC